MFEELHWKCSEDVLYYKKIVEKKHLYKFLIGLNKNLDEVRGRILSKQPLPSLREAFAEVRKEESRKKVMMGVQNTPSNAEGIALAAKSGQSQFSSGKPRRETKM